MALERILLPLNHRECEGEEEISLWNREVGWRRVICLEARNEKWWRNEVIVAPVVDPEPMQGMVCDMDMRRPGCATDLFPEEVRASSRHPGSSVPVVVRIICRAVPSCMVPSLSAFFASSGSCVLSLSRILAYGGK